MTGAVPVREIFCSVVCFDSLLERTNKNLIIFPGMLEQALGACCFNSSCTNIRYLKPYTTANEVISLLSEVTVTIPVVLYSTAKSATGSTFIPLIKTKGVTYISSEDMSVLYFDKFIRSIVSNWPLFMISLLLALDAGIIVWLLVSIHFFYIPLRTYKIKYLLSYLLITLRNSTRTIIPRGAMAYDNPFTINMERSRNYRENQERCATHRQSRTQEPPTDLHNLMRI